MSGTLPYDKARGTGYPVTHCSTGAKATLLGTMRCPYREGRCVGPWRLVGGVLAGMVVLIFLAQASAQAPGGAGRSPGSSDDNDRPAAASGRYPGSSGYPVSRDEEDSSAPPTMPGQAGQKVEDLPDDVTLWRKKDYYNARRVGDPRLTAAVTYLGEHFARMTSGSRNERAAVLLTRLLALEQSKGADRGGGASGPPSGYPGMTGSSGGSSGPSSGGYPGSSPGGSYPGSSSGGSYPGSSPGGPGMYGPGSSGPAQPARPLSPEVIAAILDALAVNGSKPAWKTITEVLAGTFNSDSDRLAAEAALRALLTHLTTEGENLLLAILVAPEKVRAKGPGEGSGAGSRSPYSPSSGDSASYPGSSYPGSSYPGSSYPGSSYPGSSYPGSGTYPGSGGYGGQGRFTATELQMRALALVEQLAPESFRTKVAKYYVDARTRAEHRGLLGRLLLASNPQNVSAQVLLHASPATDKEARATIERNFVSYSSGTLSMLLGVRFQPQVPQAGSGSGRGSGYPGSGGYPSSYPPPGSGMRPGGPSPENDDDGPSRSPTDSPYGPQPSPYGAQSDTTGGTMTYPGMVPGTQGTGYGPRGPRGGLGRFGMGLDLDTSCRVAQQLWGAQFTTSLVAEFDQIDSLQQDAPRILLASTIPTDAVRAKLYQTLRHYHSDGPQALEDAGLGTAVFSDPGFLVVLKAMPRKDFTTKETPTRIFRSRRRPQGNQPGYQGGPEGASGYGRGQPPAGGYGSGQPYSGQGPGQPKSKELDKPEYAWMAASEDLVRSMCDQFHVAGKPRRGIGSTPVDLSEGRPVEIPTGSEVIVLSEYHFEWPKSLADPGKLTGVPLDAMVVHYVRIQGRSTPAKLLSYFKRKLGGPAEHPADVGYWLESVRSVEDTDHKRSIDVLIARREERDAGKAARPGSGSPPGPYMPNYGPQARAADSDEAPGRAPYGSYPGSSGGARRPGQPGEKAEKDVTGDLIIEVLSVEIKNPSPGEETAKAPRTAKATSKDER